MTPGQAAFQAYMDSLVGPNPIGHGFPASEKVMEAWEAAAKAARDFVEAPRPAEPIDIATTFRGAEEANLKALKATQASAARHHMAELATEIAAGRGDDARADELRDMLDHDARVLGPEWRSVEAKP